MMSAFNEDKARELTFQNDVIQQFVANGWLLGKPEDYNRKLALKYYHINIFYSEEDEGYIAEIPDLRHCSAFGLTPSEALDEVLKAKEA
jgi:hypothetical protein